MANYTVKLTVVPGGVPSVNYLGSEVWPAGTTRASNIQECYSIIGLGESYTYEYFVGDDASFSFKNFTIKNKSVSHKLKIILKIPSFLTNAKFKKETG